MRMKGQITNGDVVDAKRLRRERRRMVNPAIAPKNDEEVKVVRVQEFGANGFEVHGTATRVEKLGYVPLEVRIKQMLAAGDRLTRARSEEFDFSDDNAAEDDIDTPFPVYRDMEADITDNYVVQREASERVTERKRAREADRKRNELAEKSVDRREKPPNPEKPDSSGGPKD